MFVYCLSPKQMVYHQNKWFITKTKGLSAKQKVLGLKNCIYDLGLKWYILITNYIGCFLNAPEGEGI